MVVEVLVQRRKVGGLRCDDANDPVVIDIVDGLDARIKVEQVLGLLGKQVVDIVLIDELLVAQMLHHRHASVYPGLEPEPDLLGRDLGFQLNPFPFRFFDMGMKGQNSQHAEQQKQARYPVGFVLQIHNWTPGFTCRARGQAHGTCNQGTLPEAANSIRI